MAMMNGLDELSARFLRLSADQAMEMSNPAVEVELGDVFVYILRLADVLHIDIEEETHARMDRNEERYPRREIEEECQEVESVLMPYKYCCRSEVDLQRCCSDWFIKAPMASVGVLKP